MTIILMVLLAQNPFPYPRIQNEAEISLIQGRTLFSDYPEIYRSTWSSVVYGPCRTVLIGPNEAGEPCRDIPYIPRPDELMPSLLFTGYQSVVYTAPRRVDSPKASVALSWKYELISAGIVWSLTVNGEGIKQDLLLCLYEKIDVPIQIAPGLFIITKMLRPDGYLHLELKPQQDYSLQIHEIDQWQHPMAAIGMVSMYDVRPYQPACGVRSYKYTTRPGEEMMELMSLFSDDIGELSPGDRQEIITPVLGTRECGEYPYALYYQFMTHRQPVTPSNNEDGPPLEIWNISGIRDVEESTQAVLDPESEPEHGAMAGVQEALRGEGLQGPITTDPDMAEAMAGQEEMEETRYKKGTDLGDQALALMDMLIQNPENTHLLELFERFIEPNLAHIDHQSDTEIEFNPGVHCTWPEIPPHQVPFLGAHFWPVPLSEHCGFCAYHDRIVNQPYQSWSHARLTHIDWSWNPIHHEVTGNLYERAFRFIQATVLEQANLTDLQNEMGERQVREVHRDQVETITLAELEDSPSSATSNRSRSATSENLPAFLLEAYDPCMDPSWTIEYLLLYNEITNPGDAPCPLFWGVTLP